MAMMTWMRRSSRYFLAVVVLTFIASLAYFGATQDRSSPTVVATINGEDVSAAAYDRAYRAAVEQYRQILRDRFSEELLRSLRVQDQVLERLVSERLMAQRAQAEGITNFSLFCNHVTIIPAIRAILDSPDLRLDGFVGPGHVSTVIGLRPYRFIAGDYRKPVVVSGFEPLDVLQGVYMILRQLRDGRSEVENQYSRVVREEGNPLALRAIAETMELRTTFEWRGLGFISQSALKLRDEFADWDAEVRYEIPGVRVADPKACQCGEVLKGVIKPWECKVFGTACTPDHPIGTCMVSSEGACAAYFNYGRHAGRRRAETAA